MAQRKLANWLQAYHAYVEGTESLPIFHWWTALGTLAGAAQRKIFMDMGYYQVHSNLFVVLVSRPGVGRKTTALRIGKGLLRGTKDYGVDINFSTQASSVAALVRQFTGIANKEHQSLTAYINELGSLLGTKSTETTDFLTDIFDGNPDWDKQTISRGLEKIEKPWFNMMGGTTPQWLGENLSETAVEGGFVSRTVFVYGHEHGDLVAFPELTDEQKELRRHLMHDLAVIAQIKGEFRFTDEARNWYEQWYEDPARLSREYDERLTGYYQRKHIHMKKVAMLLRLSEGTTEKSEDLVVQLQDVQTALGVLEEIEPGMKKAFTAVGKNVLSTDLERIRDQIFKNGRIRYKEVLASHIHSVPKEDLDKLLQTLMDMGEITKEGEYFVPVD